MLTLLLFINIEYIGISLSHFFRKYMRNIRLRYILYQYLFNYTKYDQVKNQTMSFCQYFLQQIICAFPQNDS